MKNNNTNPYHDHWRRFLAMAKHHKLTVRLDQNNPAGDFRSLHFGEPGTGICAYTLTATPNHLFITGDIYSGFSFRNHDHDMLAWATKTSKDRYDDLARHIDVNYWAGKLNSVPAHGTADVELARTVTDRSATAELTNLFNNHLVDLEEQFLENLGDKESPFALLAFWTSCAIIAAVDLPDIASGDHSWHSEFWEIHDRDDALHLVVEAHQDLFGHYEACDTDFTDLSGSLVEACYAVEAVTTAYAHHRLLTAALFDPDHLPTRTVDDPTDPGRQVTVTRTGVSGSRISFRVILTSSAVERAAGFPETRDYTVTYPDLHNLTPGYRDLVNRVNVDTARPDNITETGWPRTWLDPEGPFANDIPVITAAVRSYIDITVDSYRKFTTGNSDDRH